MAFFVVGGFIYTLCGVFWIVVKQCDVGGSPTPQVPDYNESLMVRATLPSFYDGPSTIQFLELKEQVKKVGCVHDCSHSNCTYDSDEKVVKHSTTGTDGGRFFLLPRYAAYPPRRS